ncbi:hypothetical protein ABT099_35135, partial [Streptomyces prasinus]|uniref:hypothetical protein n=1 Tax=Streptomyces prasinus TaxID=67345 RepID=UPI00331CA7EF
MSNSASRNPADRRIFLRTTLDLGDVLLHPWGRGDAESETMLDGLIAAAGDPLIALWNRSYSVSRSESWTHSCSLRAPRTVLGVLVARV